MAVPAGATDIFADFETTPAEHFRLHFYGAVLVCTDYVSSCAGSFDAALQRFPFLLGYNNELARRLNGLSSEEAFERWCDGLAAWESRTSSHLPLRAMRELLGIGSIAAMCLVSLGLVDEDARFGQLFEALQCATGQRRPTLGLLRRCWQAHLNLSEFSIMAQRSRRCGLMRFGEVDASHSEAAPTVPSYFWEILRGDSWGAVPSWVRQRAPEALPRLEDLILSEEIGKSLTVLPKLLEQREARAVIARGPTHSGRRTILNALAGVMGQAALEARVLEKFDETRWKELGTLARLKNAFPIVIAELGPGDVLPLPDEWPAQVPLGIVTGRQGGLSGELANHALTLSVELPDYGARCSHWQRMLPEAKDALICNTSSRHRLPAGQIHRAATLARMRATLSDRKEATESDVIDALRTLNRQTLDALARRLQTGGDWSQLCANFQTFRELQHLESRCRNREQLPALLQTAPAVGVRALFTGPSGTGKTHAASLLASRLMKDIYQLDLSAIVNKYVGETEKNLGKVFTAAEELDVILLLDEGDSLLSRRTEIRSSNDRYSNLETNFLLQRIESYQGILIVTTNARSNIDPAFERRLDVTVEFHPPNADERWELWRLHLPAGSVIDENFLGEVASRCEFTGGQIRNATLHAALLAIDRSGPITAVELEAAIRREFAKQGGVCPLRHFTDSPRPTGKEVLTA